MTTKYRNVAFLLELMINILVFSVSCAILVGLFGQASLLSRRNRRQENATGTLISLMETVKAKGTDSLTHAQWQDEENLVCYYNQNWELTSEENAAYTLQLYVGRVQFEAGELSQLEGFVQCKDGEELYRIETASYRPEAERRPS